MTESSSSEGVEEATETIMKKKIYIAPAMEITEIEMVTMLAASVLVSDKLTEDDAVMSNRRRGTWGNLWAEDEK